MCKAIRQNSPLLYASEMSIYIGCQQLQLVFQPPNVPSCTAADFLYYAKLKHGFCCFLVPATAVIKKLKPSIF